MFYDSVTKQVRNSFEYSLDSAGFGLSRHDTMPNSLRCAIHVTYLEILQYVNPLYVLYTGEDPDEMSHKTTMILSILIDVTSQFPF